MDALLNSFDATLGCSPSKRTEGNALLVASHAELQYMLAAAGALTIFAYQTPVPYAFVKERTLFHGRAGNYNRGNFQAIA